MKNKERLKICRQQRQELAITLIDCQRENQKLETRIKALEVENFKLFCDTRWKRSIDSALDDIARLNVEPPLEPLPIRPWWKVLLP